jgi:AraC family transcriptional regulator
LSEAFSEIAVLTNLFGAEKYGSTKLLATSDGRDWSSLSAEIRSHSGGVVPWTGSQYDTELCVSLRHSRSVVTRSGADVFDRTVADRGAVWLSPAGLQGNSIDISDAVPEILHIHLPSTQFAPDVVGSATDQSAVSSLRYESGFQDPLIGGIAHAIAAELQAETSAGSLLAETLAAALTARLVQNHSGKFPANDAAWLPLEGLDRRRLSRVLDYIQENLEDDLTIERLASVACLSRFHFARAFKRSVGKSPHRYVSERRLERAKMLLTQGEQPLVDIALTLRFSCQANFTRAFRQVTGQTPGQYRRCRSA